MLHFYQSHPLISPTTPQAGPSIIFVLLLLRIKVIVGYCVLCGGCLLDIGKEKKKEKKKNKRKPQAGKQRGRKGGKGNKETHKYYSKICTKTKLCGTLRRKCSEMSEL